MKTIPATLVCVLFVSLAAPPALCEPYFEQRERGWFWYEPFPGPGDAVRPKGREGHMTVEQIREKGERLFETALLFPTREKREGVHGASKTGA